MQQLRAAVHQLRERTAATLLQSARIPVRATRIQETGYQVDGHRIQRQLRLSQSHRGETERPLVPPRRSVQVGITVFFFKHSLCFHNVAARETSFPLRMFRYSVCFAASPARRTRRCCKSSTACTRRIRSMRRRSAARRRSLCAITPARSSIRRPTCGRRIWT